MFDAMPEPKRLAEFAEWLAANKRRGELEERKAAIEARRRTVQADLAKARRRTNADDLLDADALPPIGAVGSAQQLENDLGVLNRDLAQTNEAIRLAEERVEATRHRCGREAVEPLRGWHRALIVRMAKTAIELVMLARIEEQAGNRLDTLGLSIEQVTGTGDTARPGFLGGLRSRQGDAGHVALWLRELIEAGLLDGSIAEVKAFLTSEPDPTPPAPRSYPEPAASKKKPTQVRRLLNWK